MNARFLEPRGGSARAAEKRSTRSLLRYAAVFVLLTAVVADSVQLADTDLWMHIRFGQFVLHTGHLLRRDIFSYSAPGMPWLNLEWLADVVIALFYEVGGVVGLKLFKFLSAASIMSLLAMGTAETDADYLVQFVALVLAALGLRLQIQFRPQLFDYIFLSALLAMLARESRGRRAHLWMAIPMMVLWANLHGAFFVGLAVLGLYALVRGAQELLARRGWSRAIQLAVLTLAALIATLINPFGLREWYVALSKVREPLVAMNRNLEFQSLFHQLAGGHIAIAIFPIVIAVATMVACALTPRRDDLALVAIAALMISAWLFGMRNMAFAVIACTAPLAGHLSLVIGATKDKAETPPRDAAAHAPLVIQIIVLGAIFAMVVSGGIFSPRLPTYMAYPAGAVAFMRRDHLSGNILSTYEWGGYLIWHQVPPSKVFFDSFDDRYPQSVQQDYLSVMAADSGAVQVLERYPHDYVLAPVDSALDLLMKKRSDWALIYRDPVCAMFARAGSTIARTPVIEAAAPTSEFP